MYFVTAVCFNLSFHLSFTANFTANVHTMYTKFHGNYRSLQSCFSCFSFWVDVQVSPFSSVGVGSSLSTIIFDKSWVGHFFIVPGGEGPGVEGTSEAPAPLFGISWSVTDVSLAFFYLCSPCGVGLGVLGLGASGGFSPTIWQSESPPSP